MSVAPTPDEIFQRAAKEGQRRLEQSSLELVSTGFIAGFTIVFGVAALGIVHALVEPQFGSVAQITGALAFGIGVVFLIVGRAELFTENFFDPVATAFEQQEAHIVRRIARLWLLTLIFNVIGGVLMSLIFSVEGVMPAGTDEALRKIAEETAARGWWAGLMSSVAGGSLVALLSYLLTGSDSIISRALMAFLVGFLLALGPFDHVIVTGVHLLFGILFGAPLHLGEVLTILLIVTAGNLLGGIGIVTLSHAAQAKGAEE